MAREIIFFRREYEKKMTLSLSSEEIAHLRSLRIFQNTKIIQIRDGLGKVYYYEVGANEKTANYIGEKQVDSNENQLEIATAVPKAGKYEFLLQKATELGVGTINFVNCLQSERRNINSDRTAKVIAEAAAQSRRYFLPRFSLYGSLEGFMNEKQAGFFYLDPYVEETLTVEKLVAGVPIIGPEGGFHPKELQLFRQKAIPGFSLGKEILRLETACIYVLSLMKFYKEQMCFAKNLN
ncbi:MAG: RsmE family RNA methyltransferase [Spirochaetota bacterium]